MEVDYDTSKLSKYAHEKLKPRLNYVNIGNEK